MASVHYIVEVVELPTDSYEEVAPLRPLVTEHHDPRTTMYLLDILAAVQEEKQQQRALQALQLELVAQELEELQALLEEEAVLDALGARILGLSGYAMPSPFLNPFASQRMLGKGTAGYASLPAPSSAHASSSSSAYPYTGSKRSASTAFYSPMHYHYYVDEDEAEDDWLGGELLIGRLPGTQCWVIDTDPQESSMSSVPYEVLESATPLHNPYTDEHYEVSPQSPAPVPSSAPTSTSTLAPAQQNSTASTYRAPTVDDEADADAGVPPSGPPRKLARMED